MTALTSAERAVMRRLAEYLGQLAGDSFNHISAGSIEVSAEKAALAAAFDRAAVYGALHFTPEVLDTLRAYQPELEQYLNDCRDHGDDDPEIELVEAAIVTLAEILSTRAEEPALTNDQARLADRLCDMFSASQDCEIDSPALQYPPDAKDLTSHEQDLMIWSVLYGVAFGVARLEDPLETNEAVAARVLPAAADAWARYGSFHPRDDIERVEVTIAPEHKSVVTTVLMDELVTFEPHAGLQPVSRERAIELRDEFAAIVNELDGMDFGETRHGGPSLVPWPVTLRMRRNRVREIGNHLLGSGESWNHESTPESVEIHHAAGGALLAQLEPAEVVR